MIIIREPYKANRPPYLWAFDPDKSTITLVYDPEDGEKHLGMVIDLSSARHRHEISESMWMSPEAAAWLPEQ